jgi:hypothetical protein
MTVHQSNLFTDEGRKILGVKVFKSFVSGSLPWSSEGLFIDSNSKALIAVALASMSSEYVARPRSWTGGRNCGFESAGDDDDTLWWPRRRRCLRQNRTAVTMTASVTATPTPTPIPMLL